MFKFIRDLVGSTALVLVINDCIMIQDNFNKEN